jgi:hypothetical protein
MAYKREGAIIAVHLKRGSNIMAQYEAIFHGETSPTQVLANKAAWIASLSLDETEIEEPDKVAKFSAACIRLSTAANEIDIFVTDDLNRLNFEALQKKPEEALQLAKDNGKQWKSKKAKDLQKIKSLKNTFDWNAIFGEFDKESLFKIVNHQYQTNPKFKAAVDNAAGHRITYITELALKKDLQYSTADEMLVKFRAYVLEECAGVLALRLQGYTDAFYLGKLNQATADIATFTFPIDETNQSETSKLNVVLNQINQTPLKFHTPSQYKPLAKKQQNNTHKQSQGKEKPPMPLYQLHTTGIDKEALYKAFFDSKEIPLHTKVRTFEKLAAGSSTSNEISLDSANGDDFDHSLSTPDNFPDKPSSLRNGTSTPPNVD